VRGILSELGAETEVQAGAGSHPRPS
jgi:hypothetical protein